MRAAIHVDAEERGAVHRGGQRLRAAHAAQAAGHDQPAGQRAAEVLPGALGEGLVGALQDALGADVDPRAGGHLAVHREPQRFEPAELVPGGPARHQVRVGDQDPRRLVVGAEHADRLAALHQQRLVVLQPPQRGDDRVEARPVARRLAAAAVDDQLLGPLGHRGIEVVHQHPQGGFLVPAAAGDLRAARCREGPARGERGHARYSIERWAGPTGPAWMCERRWTRPSIGPDAPAQIYRRSGCQRDIVELIPASARRSLSGLIVSPVVGAGPGQPGRVSITRPCNPLGRGTVQLP